MVQWTISRAERAEHKRRASSNGRAAARPSSRRSPLSQVHWTCSHASHDAAHLTTQKTPAPLVGGHQPDDRAAFGIAVHILKQQIDQAIRARFDVAHPAIVLNHRLLTRNLAALDLHA